MEEMKKYEAFAKEIVEHAARKGLTVGEFRAAADLAKRIVNESAVGYGVADGFERRQSYHNWPNAVAHNDSV